MNQANLVWSTYTVPDPVPTCMPPAPLSLCTEHNSHHSQAIMYGHWHVQDTQKRLSANLIVTSSSAMADRPCDCLRPKSPLCSCQHCQWFCAGRDALAIHQARITRPKSHLPNAYEILLTRYDQFRTGLDDFRRIYHREGGVAHQPVLVSQN